MSCGEELFALRRDTFSEDVTDSSTTLLPLAHFKYAVWANSDSSDLVVLPLGRYLRLKMFREDHGSWMTMFFSTILFLFIFSQIYNLFLLMAGNMK